MSNRFKRFRVHEVHVLHFVVVLCLLGLGCDAAARPLGEVAYGVYGLTVEVSPSALTVPRGVSSQLNTEVPTAAAFNGNATVKATLRGPSLSENISVVGTPGGPIYLPAFSEPGTHFLENIRLELEPGVSIPATPSAVTINVLDELLVSDVTSRPLSLEEIERLGIEYDENSFQGFNFTIAFTTESGVVHFDFPVIAPISVGAEKLPVARIPTLDLAGLEDLNLPNLSIAPVMLEIIEELPAGEAIPPIPGIVVIPGNVAFLNQFFSVLLSVSNQAPDGTPLVVTDLRAEIKLPAGGDQLPGDITADPPFAPGDPEYDNPLRIARTADGRLNVLPILAAGQDGVPGNDDDVDALAPQGSGNAEFLVEGVQEGAHIVDIEIRGTLQGLPSGPVEVKGVARGAVVVRDPSFSLTFIHPDKVRAGEIYELVAHIENTSLVDANLVTVSLDSPNLSGARLLDPHASSHTIDTIPAGDSATVVFTLEALRTGQVTASSLQVAGEVGDLVSGRRLSLSAGVSEQGVPLSADTLLLPPEVSVLRERSGNDDLLFRAMALLGQAHSIATAPAGSLPAG